MEDVGAIVRFVIVPRQGEHGGGRQIDLHRGAGGDVVLVLRIECAIGLGCGECPTWQMNRRVPVAILLLDRQTGPHTVIERAAQGGECVRAIIIAKDQSRFAGEFIGGALGDDVDGATGGVAPVEGSLWTAQDFHALYVEETRTNCSRARQIDSVQIGRRGTVGTGHDDRRTDATNKNGRVSLIVGNVKSRNHVCDIFDGLDRPVEQCLAVERRNRSSRTLNIFLSPRGRNRDRTQSTGLHLRLSLA